MKNVLLKPSLFAVDLLHKCQIRILAKTEKLSQSPRQRQIMMSSAALTFAGLCIASAAYADDADGLAGMVSKAAAQGDSMKSSAGKIFAAFGFVAAGWGGYNWWKKGKEGEQSRITGGQIFLPILAGAALGATGYVMSRAGESVGIQTSSQGQLPQ